MKEEIPMNKLSIRKISKLLAFTVLLFFAVSGNGKFEWEKVKLRIEKALRKNKRATLE